MFISLSFSSLGIAGCDTAAEFSPKCDGSITRLPASYPKNSELYYFSWIEHGNFSEKASAARRLIDIEDKSEVEIADKIYRCQDSQVIRNMMTIVLFDINPEKFLSKTRHLLDESDREQGDLQGSWVKAGRDFNGEDVDFYFDWGAEGAVRLIRNGHYSKRAKEIAMQLAHSYYPADREKARQVIDLFDNVPDVNLTIQRERYDGPSPVAKQIKVVTEWFDRNEGRLEWDGSRRRYKLKS